MESDEVKFSLAEIKTTIDKTTGSGELEIKCGPCPEGRHNDCKNIECHCRRRNHKLV
ncbi:MAG TPA: hypothetical protein VJS91_10410 [Nitrososphaeraceae archaeon]|nr:hypothetical protein [Nitrososphaeraceae archaeon]